MNNRRLRGSGNTIVQRMASRPGKLVAAVTLIFFWQASSYCSAQSPQNASSPLANGMFAEGKSFYEKKDYKRAAEKFEEAVDKIDKISPTGNAQELAAELAWLAEAHKHNNNLEASLAALKRASNCSPISQESIKQIGNLMIDLSTAASLREQLPLAHESLENASRVWQKCTDQDASARGDERTQSLLAVLLEKENKLDAADSMYKSLVPLAGRLFGVDSVEYATVSHNQAHVWLRQKKWKQAAAVFQSTLDCYRKKHATDEQMALILEHLAEAQFNASLLDHGEINQADSVFSGEIARLKSTGTLSTGLTQTICNCYSRWAGFSNQHSRFSQTESICKDWVDFRNVNFSMRSAQYVEASIQIALALINGHNVKGGEQILKPLVALSQGTDKPLQIKVLSITADAYRRDRDFQAAEDSYKLALEIDCDDLTKIKLLGDMASLYEDEKSYLNAAKIRSALINIRARVSPDDSLQLGNDLLQQGVDFKYAANNADAEVTLRRALELLKTTNSQSRIKVMAQLGYVLTKENHFAESESLLLQAVELSEKATQGKDELLLLTLNQLGVCYQLQQKQQQCIPFFERACAIGATITKPSEQEELNMAMTKVNLADAYEKTKEFKKAEKLFTESLQIRESLLPRNDLNLLDSMERLAELYFREQKYELIEPLAERMLVSRQARVRDNPEEGAKLVEDLRRLARAYYRQTKFTKALGAYDQLFGAYKKYRLNEDSVYALLLQEYADILCQVGKATDGVHAYEQALALLATLNASSSKSAFNIQLSLISAYARIKDFQQANKLADQVLALMKNGNYGALSDADALCTIASAFEGQGERSSEALDLLKRAEIIVSNQLPHSASDLRLQILLAEYYLNVLDDTSKAMPYLDSAQSLLSQLKDIPSPLFKSMLFHDRGKCLLQQGKYEDAIRSLDNAASIRRSMVGNNSSLTQSTLVLLAEAYRRVGLYDKAQGLLDAVIESHDLNDPAGYSILQSAFTYLGVLQDQRQQYAEAEHSFDQAMLIAVKLAGPDSNNVAVCLLNLAAVYDEENKTEEMIAAYMKAAAIRKKTSKTQDVVAAIWHRMAVSCSQKKRQGEARTAYENELAIRKELPNKDVKYIESLEKQLASLINDTVESGAQQAKAPPTKKLDSTRTISSGNGARKNNMDKKTDSHDSKSVTDLQTGLKRARAENDTRNIRMLLSKLASYYSDNDQPSKAATCYLEIIASLKSDKNAAQSAVDIAQMQDSLGLMYESESRYDLSYGVYKEQYELLQHTFAANHPLVAFSFAHIADNLCRQGEWQNLTKESLVAAQALYSFSGEVKALKVSLSASSILSPQQQRTLDFCRFYSGLPEDTTSRDELSVLYMQERIAESLVKLGYSLKGNHAFPEELLDQICENLVDVRPSPRIDSGYRKSIKSLKETDFCNAAALCLVDNQYGRSRHVMDIALKTVDENNPEDRKTAGYYYENIAEVSNFIGDIESAIFYAKKAMSLDKAHETNALGLLAEASEANGNIVEALRYAQQFRQRCVSDVAADKRAVILQHLAEANIRLGHLFLETKDYEKAKTFLTEAVQESNQTYQQSKAFCAMANYEIVTQNYKEAEVLLKKAAAMASPRNEQMEINSGDLLTVLHDLAFVHLKIKDSNAAEQDAIRLATLIEKLLDDSIQQMSLSEQILFTERYVQKATDLLVNVSSRDQATAKRLYPYFMHWKGLLVRSIKERAAASDQWDARSAVRMLASIDKTISDTKLNQTDNDRRVNLLSKETAERDARQFIRTKTQTAERKSTNLKDLSEVLSSEELLVDMYRFTPERSNGVQRYAAFIVSGNGLEKVIDLGDARALDLNARKIVGLLADPLKHSVGDTESAPSSDRSIGVSNKSTNSPSISEKNGLKDYAFELFKNSILTNIEMNFLPRTSKLFISPDGECAKIPWNALIEKAAKNSYMVSVVDCPWILIDVRTASSPVNLDKKVLLAGDITFSDAPALPKTKVEVQELYELAQSKGMTACLLSKNDATKERVLAEIPKYSYVHLATHGYFATPNPAAVNSRGISFQAARGQGNSTELLANSYARDPLLVSGIVLAPSTEQARGRLNAEELVGSDLSGCELLTLSACETGLGQALTGQGVIGLRSAIAAAGCKSVLMSLWTVDDSSTQVLMQQFYHNIWDQHLVKAVALQKAQAFVRAQPGWEHPFYWAGWILSGNAW